MLELTVAPFDSRQLPTLLTKDFEKVANLHPTILTVSDFFCGSSAIYNLTEIPKMALLECDGDQRRDCGPAVGARNVVHVRGNECEWR